MFFEIYCEHQEFKSFMIYFCTLLYEIGETSKTGQMAQSSASQAWLLIRIIRRAFKKYSACVPVF